VIIIIGAKITSSIFILIILMLLLLLPMLLLIGRWLLPSRLAGLGIIVAIVHRSGSEVVASKHCEVITLSLRPKTLMSQYELYGFRRKRALLHELKITTMEEHPTLLPTAEPKLSYLVQKTRLHVLIVPFWIHCRLSFVLGGGVLREI